MPVLVALAILALLVGCAPPGAEPADARGTLLATSPYDGGARLEQRAPLDVAPEGTETVAVASGPLGQRWKGVGAAVTDASVALLEDRPDLVRLLLDPAAERGARLQWLRLPLSATDFSTRLWGWRVRDERVVPSPDAQRTLRFLRTQVLPLRPDLRIVATPWSAPPRFKAPATWQGGALRDDRVEGYARFLVGQVRWLRAHGYPVKALTLANEPGHAADYPTMLVSDAQLRRLALLVGPQVRRLGVALWAVDHNWGDAGRAVTALRDTPRTYGAVALHCYAGVPEQARGLAVAWVTTECTGTDDTAAGTFWWDSWLLVQRSAAAGSTGLLMWNLALSPGYHGAFGGCRTCRGLLRRSGDGHWAEAEYYVLSHLSRAAGVGSRVVPVTAPADVAATGFAHPDGSVGLYGYNSSDRGRTLRLALDDGTAAVFRLGPREVFSWTSPAR